MQLPKNRCKTRKNLQKCNKNSEMPTILANCNMKKTSKQEILERILSQCCVKLAVNKVKEILTKAKLLF